LLVITPSLFAGEPFEVDRLRDLVYVETAGEAIAVIEGGKSALIPLEGWKEATREVLRSFDCDDDWIASRIHFAVTGRLPNTGPVGESPFYQF
jgi:hypothetical protein